MLTELRAKYDRLAPNFAEASYANLEFDMERRLSIAVNWGRMLAPGDRVLEVGCGDGYLGLLFASRGYQYRGIDISPKMIEVARARAARAGVKATFEVGDVSALSLDEEPCDAFVSYMRTFFTYVKTPLKVLKAVRRAAPRKVILDLNPRADMSLRQAFGLLEAAGFRKVSWRPFFVPKDRRVPLWALRVLAVGEELPLLRSLPLRWKFHCLLLGEP